jgi:hypothetical protein
MNDEPHDSETRKLAEIARDLVLSLPSGGTVTISQNR